MTGSKIRTPVGMPVLEHMRGQKDENFNSG